ncbi:NO-inducible flavohemoprotein [Endozoicomonas elysicola]|uniref:Flavohemoprotein n=1 Tax=Endozoicomonas elysicola TaxID=305900 RepID=A0A081K9E8_9GAMM|nr:NO-inducible flavohemoprotein [Endozoicomonas elysicola]KEI70774.1 dihydropteridine reductase [Endozoicomonas elysicola]
MSLSEQTIQIVKATAPVLAEHGETITRHFYQQMFSQNPELLNIFNATNQKTGRQQAALANAVYAYAANIDNLGVLTAAVQRIAHKHASFNILPEQYPIVGKHLLEAVTHVLGDAATDEILNAWREAYGFLAALFIEVEEGIYRESELAEGGWRGTREFKVVNKVQESELITSFYFEPVDGLPVADYQPGQYIGIYLHPEQSEHRCIRQYSLSDAPNGRSYRISVKREGKGETQGMISHHLHDNVHINDIVELCPPSGDFYLNPRSEAPVVLLSGGVGQTPMLSMLNSLVHQGHQQPIIYVHGAMNSRVHAFDQHVREHTEQSDNIEQILFYDEPTGACSGYHHAGKTDLELIRKKIDLPGAHYYFCGPLGYMAMVKKSLQSWGVTEDRLHYEVFGPHKDL